VTFELSPSLFAIWSSFIKERLGLAYGPAERELLGDKLWSRAQEAGYASLLDYYYRLRYDDDVEGELEALADALVVGESYLFRELDQIEVAVRHFIEPAVAARGRARIWSAACAGGEEPATVAMVLAARGLLDHVHILASDLSRRALARAKTNRYSRRAVRGEIPPPYRAHVEVADNEVRVAPGILAAVEWRRLNLVHDAWPLDLVAFDVILCRNVLIYFDDDTVIDVVGRLAGALRPGGALLIGVS
jgi:chemotaxis protein methyltransferase CheR